MSLKHLAIIMDGNGRWGMKNKQNKLSGYKKGVENALSTINHSLKFNIKHLTLFVFSMENWQRNEKEINFLFNLFIEYLNSHINIIKEKNIKVKFIGELEVLSDRLQERIVHAENMTIHNTQMQLNLAISYGSRHEVVNAIKKIISQRINSDNLNISVINKFLYTTEIPDPDLIIRTGGQKRLSNFLLWQSAYAELYFCDTLWPDFNEKHLLEAIEDYEKRVRKYGK